MKHVLIKVGQITVADFNTDAHVMIKKLTLTTAIGDVDVIHRMPLVLRDGEPLVILVEKAVDPLAS